MRIRPSLVVLIALALFFTCAISSFADEIRTRQREVWAPSQEKPHGYAESSFLKPKNYHFEIASETYWFFYEEPSLSVEWDGVMYGARASLTQRAVRYPMVGKGEVRYAIGNVDYDGSLQDGTPHTTSGTDWTFEGRGTLGYEFTSGQAVITPFLGIGYRYWLDDLESANAYERNVRYLYSPVGFQTYDPLGSGWSWGITGEFDFLWRGWVDSHLEDVNSSFNTVKNNQESGFGLRGSFYLKREGSKTSVSIEPFIRYWDIDESDTAPVTFAGTLIGSGVEPANKTIESGLQISITY